MLNIRPVVCQYRAFSLSRRVLNTSIFTSYHIDAISPEKITFKTPKTDKNRQFFTEKLEQTYQNYLKSPSNYKPRENLTIVDYLNPRWNTICQITQNAQSNQIPPVLLSYYNVLASQDLMPIILRKLHFKFESEQNISQTDALDKSIDFSNPAQWYPETRKMKRKIIMHVGPTNSGKTYQLLQKLKASKSGYYAGPLRLLAREIYENFNQQGINCNLVTGEEVIPSVDREGKISQITSGTIEMVPLTRRMDLCIIDEIQMISDELRGEAWTNALLGVQAKEIHLCGEERTVELIKKIVELTGDEIEINNYQRLGKLQVAEAPLKNFKNLSPGDCIVSFSKRKILQLKVSIEQKTKYKVAVIYGALPPEIRSEQAHGFNKGKYDILVASDAVGMGLNLAIKRIVFSTTEKFNGFAVEPLSQSVVKQIGGRAGRFSHDKDKLGGVITAFTRSDLKYIKKTMSASTEDIKKACVWPTNEVWTTYLSNFHPLKASISIVTEFGKTNVNSDLFFLTKIDNRMDIMRLMMTGGLYKELTTEDQLRLSIAPINFSKPGGVVQKTTYEYVQNIAKPQAKSILDFNFLPLPLLQEDPKKSRTLEMAEVMEKLSVLEETHKLVLLFMWLSQRWPYLFVDIESAHDWKLLIEKRISEELSNLRDRKDKSRKRL